ncbi:MAG: hypothetical protein AB7I50_21060 [Vicinamibacterales bacterium]
MNGVIRRVGAGVLFMFLAVNGRAVAESIQYRVLATSKTSTMEKEMNAAAEAGYRFTTVMGGETSFGGSEVVVVMQRTDAAGRPRYGYKLLATSKTSTMQQELQRASDDGYEYVGQTVFETAFGGHEVVCLLERDKDASRGTKYEYKLVATKRTSTLEKEVESSGAAGYQVLGMTVGETLLGGKELIAITRRAK